LSFVICFSIMHVYNLLQKELSGKVIQNESLANYTTFKIGGEADYFFIAQNNDSLMKAVKIAHDLNLPFFILGGGSNLLVSDKGFRGLVIKVQSSRRRQSGYGASATKLKVQSDKIIADAGVSLSKLVDLSIKNELSGLEWAIGIPGTVGGAVRGNIGAFGKEIAQVVKNVKTLSISHNITIEQYSNTAIRFSYRDSIFKHNKDIILSVEFELKNGNKEKSRNVIQGYLLERKESQPLDCLSAGCIFKNPRDKSAGELIDSAGLKGKKIGNAQISEKHANFIINLGNARAEDVIRLIEIIQEKVLGEFGIKLEFEIELVGFE